VIFLCPSCGSASELSGNRTHERPLLAILAYKGGPGSAYLPFWLCGERALAPAFNGSRLLTLTKWYSGRASELTAAPKARPPALWGGRIGSSDARRLLALVEDKAPPHGKASLPEASLPTQSSTLTANPTVLALPFAVEKSRLVCQHTGVQIYLETLEAAPEILGRWRKIGSGD